MRSRKILTGGLLASAFCLAILATGCGPSDPPPATGFITEVSEIPENARIDEAGVPRDAYGRPFGYALLGEPIPAFSGTDLSGNEIAREDLAGNWTVIDVWGIWCGDCMADAPYVKELSDRLEADGTVRFLSIHTPPSASRAGEAFGKFGSVERYFEAKGYTYPTVIDQDASIRDAFKISWTPSYLLVDPEGIVRGYRSEFSAAGDAPVDQFLSDIKRVMAGG